MTGPRLFLTFALLISGLSIGNAFAQPRIKPAQRAILSTDGQRLFTSADAACVTELASFLPSQNYTRTDTISCPPYLATQTQIHTATFLYAKPASADPAHFACLINWTTTNTVSGDPQCGPIGTTTTSSQGEMKSFQEVRVCDSASGWQQYDNDSCFNPGDFYPPSKDCPKCGNPTSVGNGVKQETYALGQVMAGAATVPVELRYGNLFGEAGGALLREPSWFLDPFDRRLVLRFASAALRPRVLAPRGHGIVEEFQRTTNGTYVSFDPQVTLQAQGSTWQRTNYRSAETEIFDSQGRLTQWRSFAGGGFDLEYLGPIATLPSAMVSTTGRRVQLGYTDQRLTAIQWPDTTSTTVTYQDYVDSGRNIAASLPKSVVFPDGRSKAFDYVPGASFPAPTGLALSVVGKQYWAVAANSPSAGSPIGQPNGAADFGRALYNLSTVYDETGTAFSQFTYDDRGRVLSSQRAGGVYRFSFVYQTGRTVVTLPLGAVSTFSLSPVNGQLRPSNTSTNGAGFNHAVMYSYDSVGNLTAVVDTGINNGADTTARCMKIDAAVNRPVFQLEGGSSCPGDLSTYQPGGVERLTTINWLSDTRKEARIAEPRLITTNVFHGQADPFNGGALASCAPNGTALPDGKPLALLCKQVQQATTDNTGRAGFAASLQGGVESRILQWTYNALGQVVTATDPLNHTTTYLYYADTSFSGADPNAVGHTVGDVAVMTNAAGQSTQFVSYDRHGQLLQMIDPNGQTTTYRYDARQRLTSTNAGGRQTSYNYDFAGQLVEIALPNGSRATMTYDGARRLSGMTDEGGNSVAYVLDSLGKRTQEQLNGPDGLQFRAVSRVFDSLGRKQQTVGASQ